MRTINSKNSTNPKQLQMINNSWKEKTRNIICSYFYYAESIEELFFGILRYVENMEGFKK